MCYLHNNFQKHISKLGLVIADVISRNAKFHYVKYEITVFMIILKVAHNLLCSSTPSKVSLILSHVIDLRSFFVA